MSEFSHANDYYEKISHMGGNYRLMFKQAFDISAAIQLAQHRQLHWLFHFDTDELWSPVGDVKDIQQYLLDTSIVPAETTDIVIANLEAYPESDRVANPFEEVGLFKVHHDLFHAYVQGKSIAKLSAPSIQPHGPHTFYR